MTPARAHLESLLRAKQLDRTLTTSLPASPAHSTDEYVVAASGVTALDAALGGGFPRGQVSELVGPRSSGRTSALVQLLAAATARGELAALVDALDVFDPAPASASAAGIDLSRVLWIRGQVTGSPAACHEANQRALDHAIKALALVLQAGNFGLVAFDVAEAPRVALGRLPFTTWLRLQRMIEGSQTVCLLVGNEPIARSAGGLTLQLSPASRLQAPASSLQPPASGQRQVARFRGRLFAGLDIGARVIRAKSADRDVCVSLSTAAV